MSCYTLFPVVNFLQSFKKLTTGNNVFIVSVFIYSNCCMLQFLHQMFNVSSLLLDDVLLKCVATEVVSLSIVAFKTLTFHKVPVV